METNMFTNVTPHEINVIVEGETITIPRSGTVWRVGTESKSIAKIVDVDTGFKIPIVVEETTGFEFGGIPPVSGRHYIVSRPMATALKEAGQPGHFYVPGELVRNDQGQPIGCKNLVLV